MARSVIKIGIVGGVSNESDSPFEALRHQPRLQLVGFFDPNLGQATNLAKQWEVQAFPSLETLLRHADGVIVADDKWLGIESILRALAQQRPALMLSSKVSSLGWDELMQLKEASQSTGNLLMPELRHRWSRSTLRVRELTATLLGAIESIELTSHQTDMNSYQLGMLMDWCCNVIQSEPRNIHCQASGNEILLKFRRLDRDGTPVTARIRISADSAEASQNGWQADLVCRHGKIHFHGEEALEWQVDRRIEKEQLSKDRSPSQVMFDLFGRRLAGGLVPVPDITDLIRGHALIAAWKKSQETGEEASLS